jgi:hypothetical protein
MLSPYLFFYSKTRGPFCQSHLQSRSRGHFNYGRTSSYPGATAESSALQREFHSMLRYRYCGWVVNPWSAIDREFGSQVGATVNAPNDTSVIEVGCRFRYYAEGAARLRGNIDS